MNKKVTTYFVFTCIALLFVACEKDLFTEPEEVVAKTTAKLVIRSNPSGSLIYYNNKNMGLKTPDTLSWLPSGDVKIVLKRDLYFDEIVSATVEQNKTSEVFVDYASNPKQYGDFSCLSFVTGATVYINGVKTGYTTPHTFTHMIPGKYSIKYTMKNYRADSASVILEAGAIRNTNFSLQDTSRWVDYQTFNSNLLTDNCYSIIVDKKNVKWIGSGRGVNCFDGKNWKSYDYTNSVVKGPVVQLVADHLGNIWAASNNGLFMFNGITWIDYSNNIPATKVMGLTCDIKGDIWVATYSGLAKYNGYGWEVYKVGNSGLIDDLVNTISSAPDGKIWIGTIRGVCSFDGKKWTSYTLSSMNLDVSIGNNARYICADSFGNIWISYFTGKTERGGFVKFDGSKWNEVTLSLILTSDIAFTYVDSNNRKWLSTANSLGVFNQPTDLKKFSNLDTRIPVKNVTSSCMDGNGDIWFSTSTDGVVKIKKGNY